MTTRGKKPGENEFSDDRPTTIDPPRDLDDRKTLPVMPRPASNARAKTPTGRPTAPALARPPQKPKPAPPQQIKAISMKTPADPNAEPAKKLERDMPHIQLRAMSEMSRANQPLDLGNLAPPYDPAQARARTVRDYVMWGSLAVALAVVIAVAVWMVAA